MCPGICAWRCKRRPHPRSLTEGSKGEEMTMVEVRGKFFLGKATEPKTFDIGGARPVEPQTAAAPTPRKYVPRHLRMEVQAQAPPSKLDRGVAGRGDDCGGREREALLGNATEPKTFDIGGARPVEPQTAAPAAAAAAPTSWKYLPRHLRMEVQAQAPPSETDRGVGGRGDDRGGREREALLGKATEPKAFDICGARPIELQTAAPAAAATAPTPRKYVPRHLRMEVQAQAPPSELDRGVAGRGDDCGGSSWRIDGGSSSKPTTWFASRVS